MHSSDRRGKTTERRATSARAFVAERAAAGVAALGIAVTGIAGAAGCAPAKRPEPVGVSAAPREQGIAFTYDSLDDRPVTSDAMRGKPVVIAFVTTWDLTSQAQVDFLVPMSKNDGDQVRYVLVALQERQDRELVEVYRTKLGVTFPVALGDRETIAGGGPFGDVHNVPTVVVLDREGRRVWQKSGLAKNDEIRAALRGI